MRMDERMYKRYVYFRSLVPLVLRLEGNDFRIVREYSASNDDMMTDGSECSEMIP